jgi:hypothetical protein
MEYYLLKLTEEQWKTWNAPIVNDKTIDTGDSQVDEWELELKDSEKARAWYDRVNDVG